MLNNGTRARRSSGRTGAAPEQVDIWRPTGRAGHAIESAGLWPPPGRAGFDIVPASTSRRPTAHRTMSYRATLAMDRSSAPLPATKQATGAPSAWSQSFNHPPRDHADGATLGRRRRTRRPVLRKAKITVAVCGCGDVEILPALSARVCRVIVPVLKGLAAGHECPAYSSDESRIAINRCDSEGGASPTGRRDARPYNTIQMPGAHKTLTRCA